MLGARRKARLSAVLCAFGIRRAGIRWAIDRGRVHAPGQRHMSACVVMACNRRHGRNIGHGRYASRPRGPTPASEKVAATNTMGSGEGKASSKVTATQVAVHGYANAGEVSAACMEWTPGRRQTSPCKKADQGTEPSGTRQSSTQATVHSTRSRSDTSSALPSTNAPFTPVSAKLAGRFDREAWIAGAER